MSASNPLFSSVNVRQWSYDVFLSCSCDETTKTFTDHLYSSLTDAGINTFRNDQDLPSDAEKIVRAIHESQICLVLFSQKYADSRTCLETLAEIVQSSRFSPQLVLPVFYDVDPSDLPSQSNNFSYRFAEHDEQSAANWKAAMTAVAGVLALDLRNLAYRHEGKFIKKIVKKILKELSITILNVATYPIGIEERMQKLSSMLGVGTNHGTLMVGIYGKAGTGKTTLCKAIYNQYFHSFQGKSFLANIRLNSTPPNGIIHLQQQLLMDILKKDNITISNLEEGCDMMKGNLQQRRVLVILDDVDQMDQIMALSAQREWFGMGSRIIITTRNMQLLEGIGMDQLYGAENFVLSEDEALELFCWHAFQKPRPCEEFLQCCEDIVLLFGSSPLALERLGSFLGGRAVKEWRSAIEKWKRMPLEEMLQNINSI